jgi:hypothetical protein
MFFNYLIKVQSIEPIEKFLLLVKLRRLKQEYSITILVIQHWMVSYSNIVIGEGASIE